MKNFPGYIGYGGIIAIHANWPVYPMGLGWEIALQSIGNFPFYTRFFQVDDIDRCILFSNTDSRKKNKHTLYLALWHEDLLDLQKKGYVEGIKPQTQYEWEMVKFERAKRAYGKNLHLDNKGNIVTNISIDGKQVSSWIPRPEYNEDDDILDYRDFVQVPKFMTITRKGIIELEKITQENDYHINLKELITPFLKLQRYDTAIREASLLIETKLKNLHKVNLFGYHLVNYHIGKVIEHNEGFNSSAIKCYKTELQTIFSFIRNDYAHNFKEINLAQCKSIVYRIDQLYKEIDEVIEVYNIKE